MFIIKVASRCNLDCSYCYVYQSPDKSWQTKPKFLSIETIEQIAYRIHDHVFEHNLADVSIVFHGGEPLLAGVERFKNYVQTLTAVIKCPIQFGIQTNAILLDIPMIDFFYEYNFRIGISLDGNKEYNDRHRIYPNKSGSYDDTINGIKLLQSYPDYKKIFGGVLIVVHVENEPLEILKTLEELGIGGANLLLPDSNYESPPFRTNDDPLIYGKWLYKFFKHWFDNYSHIEVPYFEEIINLMLGGVSSSEEIGAKSVDFVVIDTNGDIEAVDTLKMVGSEATSLNLNVGQNSLNEALEHPAIYSRMSGYHALCEKCRNCEYLNNCGGGYIPHRYSEEKGFINPSVYCDDLKYLFANMYSHIFQ
ncbi:uncharacterized protein FHS11_005201 [Mucilaginibacter gotjawali]|nr:uncharacterized protein [Mucilaginibacter gotjawali]